MTPGALRRACAVLVTSILVLAAATPAAASARNSDQASETPIIFDVLIMRPIGFVALGLGTGLFAASMPILAVSRPQDIGKPFDRLIVRPCRFLWSDPLGRH
jgi:hypothetical protein